MVGGGKDKGSGNVRFCYLSVRILERLDEWHFCSRFCKRFAILTSFQLLGVSVTVYIVTWGKVWWFREINSNGTRKREERQRRDID